MKQPIIILLFLSFTLLGYAQRVRYAYDNAGNRISRTIVFNQMQAPKKQLKDSLYYTETVAEKEIKLFPNPVNTSLNVHISGYEEKLQGTYLLFDMQGKTVLQESIIAEKFQIDMSAYSAGTYVLRIVIADETTNWKVVKQ